MKSIRRQLIISLLVGLALLLAAFSTGLFLYTRTAFIDQFDQSLKTKILSFCGMCEVEDRSGIVVLDVEFDEIPLPEFRPSANAEYYQVWKHDGSVLARSQSMEGRDLPRFEPVNGEPVLHDLTLPDGRRGRAASVWFYPAAEPGKEPDDYRIDAPENRLLMAMARSREDLDKTFATLLLGYLATDLLLIVGIILLVRMAVSRGLVPLDRIAKETATIESSNLTHRIPLAGLPEELEPIGTRLNELLSRLESAFNRERRFSGDIAHELRTPIAELRTLAEVALKSELVPDFQEVTRARFTDVLEIAKQMENLVATLLTLVRSAGEQRTKALEPVDLTDLIKRSARPCLEEAKGWNISFKMDLPERVVVLSHKTLLSALASNLFSNAVTHTPEQGSVRCEVKVMEEGVRFCLSNTNLQLKPEDLDHLFEPLWKKDPSRTDTDTNGLGLSLVAAYAGLLDLVLKTELPKPDLFRISFILPRHSAG